MRIKLFKKIAIALFTVSASSSVAQLTTEAHLRDNGGGIISCDGQTEILDLYEGHLRSETLPELKDTILARMDPSRFESYLKFKNNFNQSIHLVDVEQLNDINDRSLIEIPKDCQFRQIVIQSERVTDVEFTVAARSWNLLTNKQKDILILHEFLYHEVLHQIYAHDNSDFARKWLRYFFQKTDTTLNDYITFLKSVFVETYSYKSFPIILFIESPDKKNLNYFNIEYYDDYSISKASPYVDGVIFEQKIKLPIRGYFPSSLFKENSMTYEFWPNGVIKLIDLQISEYYPVDGERQSLTLPWVDSSGKTHMVTGLYFEFNQAGHVTKY